MEKLIFHPLDEGFYAAEVPKGLFSERMIVTFGIAKTLKLYGETEWNIFLDRFKNLPIAEAKMLRPLLSNSEICYGDKESTRIYIPHSLMNYACIAEDAVVEKTEDGCFILRNSQ